MGRRSFVPLPIARTLSASALARDCALATSRPLASVSLVSGTTPIAAPTDSGVSQRGLSQHAPFPTVVVHVMPEEAR